MQIHRRIDSLCQGLPWQEWDAVLEHGRHITVSGSSWLETIVAEGETTAIFLSGRVGLRALCDDIDASNSTIPCTAPAVISLPEDMALERAHWVLVQSTVCLFTSQRLQKAFAASPKFASNLVTVLQDQLAYHLQCTTQTDSGLGRISSSLLSRLTHSSEQKGKVIVTQSQLAMETGLSRQWVNQLLKQLEVRGIAERRRGHIILHNLSGLEAVPAQDQAVKRA